MKLPLSDNRKKALEKYFSFIDSDNDGFVLVLEFNLN
jgi:hypothetical protein